MLLPAKMYRFCLDMMLDNNENDAFYYWEAWVYYWGAYAEAQMYATLGHYTKEEQNNLVLTLLDNETVKNLIADKIRCGHK